MTPTDGRADQGDQRGLDDLLRREWLITNHVGGYASSTIPCLNTRKYHGLLVAALSPPVQRMVLLSRVEETVHCDGWPTPLACNEYPGAIFPNGNEALRAFSREPFPRWAYQGDGWTIEKSLQLLEGQNTVVLTYTLLGHKRIDLEIRPLLALRSMHELTYQWNAAGKLAAQEKSPGHHRIPPTARTPEIFFAHDGDAFDGSVGDESTPGTATWYFNTIYRREQERGYAGLEDLWSPGIIRWTNLLPGQSVHLVCSADPIDREQAIAAAEFQCARACEAPAIVSPPAALASVAPGPAREPRDTDHDLLVRAAETFVLDMPAEQIEKSAIAMLTRLPWSPPGARDSLIAMTGVLLVTGKFAQAKAMLLGLAARMRNGLVPTEFPENAAEPERFDGADTSLWFVHGAWQYLRYSGEGETAATRRLLSAATQIVRTYHHGANAGISTDRDGLLVCVPSGHASRAATWMDARIGDEIITPRLGRPVEVNALWYNALRIVQQLSDRFGHPSRARELGELADRVYESFNRRFWNPEAGCCFDLVADEENGGPDASIRPNQLLALSLPFPVLRPDRHAAVLERIAAELLTPFGPRTLSPRDPAYHGRYGGDLSARERACHQGCVHPWLLGPYITAMLRVRGRGDAARKEARGLLVELLEHVRGSGCGQLCELFDGDAPHRPGGAIASAAAVGELLRCYVEDIFDRSPSVLPPAGTPVGLAAVTQASATSKPTDPAVTIKPASSAVTKR